jgi:hypothetical protein
LIAHLKSYLRHYSAEGDGRDPAAELVARADFHPERLLSWHPLDASWFAQERRNRAAGRAISTSPDGRQPAVARQCLNALYITVEEPADLISCQEWSDVAHR